MKLIVFGANNLLGKRLCSIATQLGHTIVPAIRNEVQYTDIDSLFKFISKHNEPDTIVINLSYAVPDMVLTTEMILLNSFFPQLLANVTATVGLNMIHVSSDAVFSGHNRYRNSIETNQDSTTYYGKSRALGEVVAANVCVVRVSYVSIESAMVQKILQASPSDVLDGWINYKWSVTTIEEVARGLLGIAGSKFLYGYRHLCPTEPISKYDMIVSVMRKLDKQLKVNPVYYPCANKVLIPTDVCKSLEEALYDPNDHTFDL